MNEYELNIPNEYVERVREWNEKRNLLTKCDVDVEYKMLQEELDELHQAQKEWNVHEQIDAILDICVVYIGSCIKASIHNVDLSTELNGYNVWHSIVELAFEEVRKLGYEPNCAFNECLLEIESRTGFINTNGKFQKYKEGDKEFTGNYKANYELCKLKEL